MIEDVYESCYEINVDYFFFMEFVFCEVYNKVGSINVSILVNVYFVFWIVVDFKFIIIDIGFDVIFICVWVGNFFFIFIWIKKDLNMVLSNSN